MMNENDMHDMHGVLGAGIGEEPPIVGGPGAVFAGARTRMVRTRALTGALSAAAVLGVAAGAVALSGGSGGSGGSGQQAVAPAGGGVPTSQPSTASGVPAPLTGAKPSDSGGKGGVVAQPAPKPGPGQVLADGRTTAYLLQQMLPAGLTASHFAGQDSFQPERNGVQTYGRMAVDNGHGLTQIGLNVQQDMALSMPCADGCTKLGDGSWIIVRTVNDEKPTNGKGPAALDYQVEHDFPTGLRIVTDAANYFDDPLAPHDKGWTLSIVQAQPALTVDQLKAIVMDSRWQLLVDKSVEEQSKKDLVGYNDQTQH